MNSDGDQSGVVYVIFGSRDIGDIDLSTLLKESSLFGFAVNGAVPEDALGLSVSGAGSSIAVVQLNMKSNRVLSHLGDVNDDGFDDGIIGAVKGSEMFCGAVYIVYGSEVYGRVDLTQLNNNKFLTVSGPKWSWFGFSLSGAGDINFLIWIYRII